MSGRPNDVHRQALKVAIFSLRKNRYEPRSVLYGEGPSSEKVETLDLEKQPSNRTSRAHSCTWAKKLVWKAERTCPQLNYKSLS